MTITKAMKCLDTFESTITKTTASFVASVHIEGVATTGRAVYKGVTSAKLTAGTSMVLKEKVKSRGGGRYINKMMKW